MTKSIQSSDFYSQIIALLQSARKQLIHNVNQTMLLSYFEVGRRIVVEEQQGKNRAKYGKGLLKELSKQLQQKFGRGFSVYNLENMRKFYLVYSKKVISETVFRKLKTKQETGFSTFKLSWSHQYLRQIHDKFDKSRKN